MKKTLLSMAIFLTYCFAHQSTIFAGGGDVVRGGGEFIAADFQLVMQRVQKAIEFTCGVKYKQDPCQDYAALKNEGFEQIKKVISNSKLKGKNGRPRAAGNNGKDTIEVHPTLWPEMRKKQDTLSHHLVVAMVIHEVAVIADLEENDVYHRSEAFLDFLLDSQVDLQAILEARGSKGFKLNEGFYKKAGETVIRYIRHRQGEIQIEDRVYTYPSGARYLPADLTFSQYFQTIISNYYPNVIWQPGKQVKKQSQILEIVKVTSEDSFILETKSDGLWEDSVESYNRIE